MSAEPVQESMWFRFSKNLVSLVSLGMSFLLAATGALGVNQASAGGAQVIFVGLYMIAFASTLFFYEMFQICPCSSVEFYFKKNFGFMYGPIGRGCYTLLIGVFSFGLSRPRSLAIATGVIVGFWGCVLILLSLFVKNFFPPPQKIIL